MPAGGGVGRIGERAKEQAFASDAFENRGQERDRFICEFRPRASPIFSKAAAMSAVRFLKGRRPHFPSQLRARQIPG